MRIVLFDPNLGKFTSDMKGWWEARGHEVKMSRYYDPTLVAWGEIIWFDTCDNNLHCATDPPKDDPDFADYDMHDMDLTGKQVIVRVIDIEVWGGHQYASKWDVVDEIIFIAPHIRELANIPELPLLRQETEIHTIPCAVDLDRWAYRERQPGFDIAVVGERWVSKGSDLILQIALKLKQVDPRYKIHWLGQLSAHWPWEHAYLSDFIEHNGLNIEITNILQDDVTVDEFLEGKNYLLSCSKKEAFGYNIAEAMAKGIKPVVHRFFGADDIWPGMTWNGIDEAVQLITEESYDSFAYKKYLAGRGYVLPVMMNEIDKIIRGEVT